MRKYIIPLNLIMLVLLVFSPLYAYADLPKNTPAPQQINTAEYRVSDNTVVHATGRTWTDEHGQQVYEYKARIDSAPSYANGDDIDTTWYSKAAKKWEAGNNLFEARVIGDMVCVTYNNKDMLWSPQVYIGGVEYKAAAAVLIGADPQNGNYQNNILSWDYGVCERRLRLIEGAIIETYIFKANPGADIQIKSNTIKDNGFTYDAPVFAYDANYMAIPISADKTIKAEDLKAATFPITVDPTDSFTTSSSDGYIQSGATGAPTWAQVWNGYMCVASDAVTTIWIGQTNAAGSYIWRSYFYFDTTSIPDTATISAANLYLYGETDSSVTNFNISVQNGMPTYPHDPLSAWGDWPSSYYSGNGTAGFNTSGFTTSGYNNISLNSTGLSWIDKTGTTKLCLRSKNDIDYTVSAYNEYVRVYSYEQGTGYWPYLDVVYTSNAPPTLQTSAASYVAKTTARINGLVTYDGGEAANVSFNYRPWYSAGWQDCIEFTIDATYVDADLTNYPVLVTGAQLNTTDTDFWSVVNSTGSDILFTNSAGTKLNRELVSIDTTNKSMECYVNVTSIDDTTDTKIYMYYNSANISLYNESNSTATWNPEYIAIWHMNDLNTSAIDDSTANNYIGTKNASNVPQEGNGYFTGDKAQLYDGIGNDVITYTLDMGYTTDTTTEIFAKLTRNTSVTNYLLAHYNLVYYNVNTGNTIVQRFDNSGAYTKNLGTYTNDSWFIGAGTYDVGVGTNCTQNGALNNVWTGETARTKIAAIDQGGIIGTNSINGSITEVRISNIVRSVSWLDATYHNLYTPTTFCSVTDVFTSTSTQSKSTGESFYSDLTGLTGNTLYGYKTEGTNSYGTAWGSWVTFTTSATCAGPGNLSAYPNATAVELVWQKGSGATGTMIRYKEGAYPSSTTDGELVYNGSATSCIQTGMDPGTSYYYRAWSDDGSGTFSANYSSALTTTFAGDSSVPAAPDAPTAPNGWFQAPDYTRMANFPGYSLINAGLDAGSIPRNSGWMALAVLTSILAGIAFYFLTKHNLTIAVGVAAVSLGLSASMGLLSWWYVGIFLIAAIALSWKAVTR